MRREREAGALVDVAIDDLSELNVHTTDWNALAFFATCSVFLAVILPLLSQLSQGELTAEDTKVSAEYGKPDP